MAHMISYVLGCLGIDDSFLSMLSESSLIKCLTYLNIKNNRKFTEEGFY